MKVYEKPRLSALSLSGADLLCTGCVIDIWGEGKNSSLFDMLVDTFGLNNIFLEREGCSKAIDSMIDGYCKFTAADEGYQVVYTS